MGKSDLKYDENSYGGLKEKKGKIYKVKYKCNACGYIDYLLECPKCKGGMFKYKNQLK